MSASPHAPASAPVIELSGFRRRRTWTAAGRSTTAQLLSLRQSLGYEASVEIDNLEQFTEQLDPALVVSLKRQVRRLLDREFGRLRVHRDHRNFVARHRSVDSLIAGLLRVQFHAMQVRLPEHGRDGKPLQARRVTLTWGVGQNGQEADLERLRRRGRR